MKDEPPILRPKLRPWFWPTLFAPVVVSALGTTLVGLFGKGDEQLGLLVTLNLLAAVPINGICSACCAVHLSRTRTAEAKPAWIVLGTLGFFIMNGALAFGGCTAGVFLSEAIQH